MYNKSLVIPGILIFLLVVLSPIIYNSTSASAPPELPSSAMETHNYPSSIPMDTWKSEHMKYVDSTTISNCKGCHGNTAEFCDKCHSFVGVRPSILE